MAEDDSLGTGPAEPRAAENAHGARRPSRQNLAVAAIGYLIVLFLALRDRDYVAAASHTAAAAIIGYLATRPDDFYAWEASRPPSARSGDFWFLILAVVLGLTQGGIFRFLPLVTLLVVAVRLGLGFRHAQSRI